MELREKVLNRERKSKRNRLFKSIMMLILSVAVAGGAYMAYSSYAYYSDSHDKVNKLSIGENTTVIQETFTPPDHIVPGDTFTKKPVVKNTGTVPCYVRMFCELSNSDAAAFTTLDFNTTDWTEKQSDGYYYYKKILQPGASTTALFTTVKISDSIDASQLMDYQIIVYEESVQSGGFSNYTEAFASIK